MPRPKINPALAAISVLLLTGLVVGVVAGISDETGGVQRGAPYIVPASARPRAGADTKAPITGRPAAARTRPGLVPPARVTHTAPTHTEMSATTAPTKTAPAGTPRRFRAAWAP
jgi:hypothetical protein